MNLNQLDGKRVTVTFKGETVAIEGVATLVCDPYLGEALQVSDFGTSIFLQSSRWLGTIANADGAYRIQLDA